MIKPYWQDNSGVLYCGDCLEIMKEMPDKSVDLVLTDPPYGTTNNEWDGTEWMKGIWPIFNRICDKTKVMFSSQPFTTDLINSYRSGFKYQWIWNKCLAGNGILAKIQPLKIHEDICCFDVSDYFPQKRMGRFRKKGGITDKHGTFSGASSVITQNDEYYPESILTFSGASLRNIRKHPTEKPIDLLNYLVRTYSKSGNTILDPFAGSGTTLRAAKDLGRRYIGIEISEKYCEIAAKRLGQETLFAGERE